MVPPRLLKCVNSVRFVVLAESLVPHSQLLPIFHVQAPPCNSPFARTLWSDCQASAMLQCWCLVLWDLVSAKAIYVSELSATTCTFSEGYRDMGASAFFEFVAVCSICNCYNGYKTIPQMDDRATTPAHLWPFCTPGGFLSRLGVVLSPV